MKTLVFLHGFGETAQVWEPFKNALQPDYQVLTPDYSEAEKLETMEEYADWVYAQLTLAEVVKCALVGHSMGGYIALAFAEKYPQFLTGLGVFHSTAFADTPERQAKRLENSRRIREEGAEAFLESFIPTMYAAGYADRHPEQIEWHLESVEDIPAEALATAMDAMRIRPDRTEVLKQAPWPVLFIIGRQDKSIPAADMLDQARWPAEAYQLVLEDVGHMGMMEAPDACLTALRAWLEKI
jgi:pimeloyl-ACP methyl ester carboxylesterase